MVRPAVVQKRKPERTRLYLQVTLESDAGLNEARLRDVSDSGALLEAPIAPPLGSKVQLTYGETAVEGRVAWVDSTWFGVEFNQPLTGGNLFDLKEQKLRMSAPRWYRREVLDDDVSRLWR